jgi:fatty-acyl-CoA synthase
MLHYWEDPEKTAETKQNGWVHTGDIGVIDDDGFVSIVGRSKDMIIRGGENISPFEIETFFDKRKWIRDIQVIGVHDDYFGEEIAAWIIPDREVTDPTEMIKELLERAQGNLAHYKLPRYIYLCDAFPLTVTGKVRKNVIREEMNALIKAKSPKVLKFCPSKNK